jgi:hypothetical protein
MADYRLYCLDRVNRFTRTENFEAPDDEEAVRKAEALARDALRWEIWERNRLVRRTQA